MEKIIIGRDRKDLEAYGSRGTVFIGSHIVGEGEDFHLANPVHMDVVRPHVILIAGKRGSGKSYTGAVIAEEITKLQKEIKKNISVLMIDTMGIYWSMGRPNEQDAELLREWGLKPEGVKMRFFVPKGFIKKYNDVGVKVDRAFTLSCGDMTATDWMITFGFKPLSEEGLAIERAIKKVQSRFGRIYSIKDIIKEIENDKKTMEKTKNALVSRFLSARDWGVFERMGTPAKDFFKKGEVTVLDVSHYTRTSTGWSVRSMLVGLFARKIFHERLTARKSEEFEVMGGEAKKTIPMVWIMIDEAHQFVPSEGITAASEPLLTLVKEGRQPGISLVMITQRPNKLHPDVLAQSDIIISHRLTAEEDIKALRAIMQTYMIKDIQEYINSLPRQKGSAIVLDDNSERIYSVQIRPRLSWHAGGSPIAIKKKGIFD